jgi:small subunit ribosomal protein S7
MVEEKIKEETKVQAPKEVVAPKVEAKETTKAETKTAPKVEAKKTFVKREFKKRDFHKTEFRPRQEEEKTIIVKKKSQFAKHKLFNRWSFDEVVISDPSQVNYVNLEPMIVPHSFGRKSRGRFAKKNINVVERLANKMMRSGQGKRKLSGKYIRGRNGCGKKVQVLQIVEGAFEIVETKTKKNPIQVLVDAISNATPHEDVTRVKKGGVAYSVAVDVSPMKGLDESLKNIALAGFGNSFNKKTTAEEALAEEIIAAAANDVKSLAVKRKDEVERIAKSSR